MAVEHVTSCSCARIGASNELLPGHRNHAVSAIHNPGPNQTSKLYSPIRSLRMVEGGFKRSASPNQAISPPPLRRKVDSTVTSK